MVETETKNIEFKDILNVVIIQVLDERYLLEVEYIKEIYVPGDNIVPVPLADKSIVGIINIRGEIYSIISLRHNIFDVEFDYGLSTTSRILLLEYEDLKIAIKEGV